MKHIKVIPSITAIVAIQILGFAYYHPSAMGTTWKTLLGLSLDQGPVGIGPIVISILCAIGFTLGFQWLSFYIKPTTFKQYLQIACGIWILFLVPSLAGHYAFIGIDHKVLLIDSLFNLICVLVVATAMSLTDVKAKA